MTEQVLQNTKKDTYVKPITSQNKFSKSTSKNSCLLLILCSADGTLTGKISPCTGAAAPQILGCRVLWATASLKYPSVLKIPKPDWRFALHFQRSRITLSEGTWELLCSSCTKWAHSHRAQSLLFSAQHQTPGKLFLGQFLVPLFQSPGQEYGGDRLETFGCFQIPLHSCMQVKIHRVLPHEPAFCCNFDWCSLHFGDIKSCTLSAFLIQM